MQPHSEALGLGPIGPYEFFEEHHSPLTPTHHLLPHPWERILATISRACVFCPAVSNIYFDFLVCTLKKIYLLIRKTEQEQAS